jgi:hypothetical protein
VAVWCGGVWFGSARLRWACVGEAAATAVRARATPCRVPPAFNDLSFTCLFRALLPCFACRGESLRCRSPTRASSFRSGGCKTLGWHDKEFFLSTMTEDSKRKEYYSFLVLRTLLEKKRWERSQHFGGN